MRASRSKEATSCPTDPDLASLAIKDCHHRVTGGKQAQPTVCGWVGGLAPPHPIASSNQVCKNQPSTRDSDLGPTQRLFQAQRVDIPRRGSPIKRPAHTRPRFGRLTPTLRVIGTPYYTVSNPGWAPGKIRNKFGKLDQNGLWKLGKA